MDLPELYRDIVETSPDGIWVIDLDGRTLYANHEIARMHRIDPAALADLTVFDTLDDVGREQFAHHLAELRAGRTNPAEVEVQWVRSDGDIVWVRCRESALHDEHGRPTAILHRYTDDTERHELIASLQASEEALEDQVSQNNFMQAVASAANEAGTLAEVLLHARHMVLLHDDWERARAFVPTADGSGAVQAFYPTDEDKAADEGDEFAPVELALAQRAYDERAPVWDDRRLTIAFPVLLDEEPYAVVVITSAPPLWRFELIESMAGQVAEQLARVAERERASTLLAQARDDAMAASRQKSEFLATMSHEIRTPLNGVIGLNDLLLRTDLAAEQRRLSAGVQVASRALLGLINDILDFSKIEAGRLELEQLDFEVRPLLEHSAGLLTESVRDKGLDLVVSCHPDVPATLRGDPTRLAQVLTNLVSNAVKFTERGGVIVRATAARSGDHVELRVEVTDTGIGVPASKLAHLFDPFTQADSSTTRVYGGSGLGLAISREIVEAMGGHIGWAPNLGHGSVFTFTALLEPAAHDGTGDRSASVDDDHARRVLAGHHALVVDDNRTNREILHEQLAWWGVTSDSTGSVAEAMAMLRAAFYDVVLLDLSMPGQDGIDLAREVRADPAFAGLQLLMLTSVTALDPDVVREAGIDRVLSKPVLSSVLRGALLDLLAEDAVAPTAAVADEDQPAKGLILVVEDNPINQMVATGLLEALGYTTETAADGLLAVEAAREGSFDAVLMDVQMPRMDGYTATRTIRAQETGTRLPIIAMTAAAVEGEWERCRAAGMDDFLTKPIDATRLTETLERWLRPAASDVGDRLDIERLDELRELDDPQAGTSYVDRVMTSFLGRADGELADITAAAAAGDAERVGALAHRLVGSALNLGAVPLGEAAREVEDHARAGAMSAVDAALPALAERLADTLDAMRAYLGDRV